MPTERMRRQVASAKTAKWWAISWILIAGKSRFNQNRMHPTSSRSTSKEWGCTTNTCITIVKGSWDLSVANSFRMPTSKVLSIRMERRRRTLSILGSRCWHPMALTMEIYYTIPMILNDHRHTRWAFATEFGPSTLAKQIRRIRSQFISGTECEETNQCIRTTRCISIILHLRGQNWRICHIFQRLLLRHPTKRKWASSLRGSGHLKMQSKVKPPISTYKLMVDLARSTKTLGLLHMTRGKASLITNLIKT